MLTNNNYRISARTFETSRIVSTRMLDAYIYDISTGINMKQWKPTLETNYNGINENSSKVAGSQNESLSRWSRSSQPRKSLEPLPLTAAYFPLSVSTVLLIRNVNKMSVVSLRLERWKFANWNRRVAALLPSNCKSNSRPTVKIPPRNVWQQLCI